MLPSVTHISNLIENQFPSFYKEEGENFIAFIKAYYQFLEQQDNTTTKTRNLFNTRDIDLTANVFLTEFRSKYFANFPKLIEGNERFLQKHILDLYRSKGSEEGVKLLFRLLYNEDINVYVPSKDILKASDGIWVEQKYIEISNEPINYLYNLKYITGLVSGATAFVESYKKIYIDNKTIHALYVTNISGTFEVYEQIIADGISINQAASILGSPESITITFATPNQPTGEFLATTAIDRKTIFDGVVTESFDVTDGFINFVIEANGNYYSQQANISVSTGSNTLGFDANFTSVKLANTFVLNLNENFINYVPHDRTNYIDSNAHILSDYDFIKIANNTLYANGDLIRYVCHPGNTVISGLSNGSFYYVVCTNTSGFKLSSTYDAQTFNANSSVNSTIDFISLASNPYSNGDILRYVVSAGNTALTNLVSDEYYYAVYANSTGTKLANSYIPTTFNPALAIANTVDDYFIQIPSNVFANDTIIRYTTSLGNTAIAALANNTYYYVVEANTLGIKLSSSSGGSAILLYSNTLPSEDGHNIYGPGTAIDLTKGLTESGHAFFGSNTGSNPVINITKGIFEFGHAFTDRGINIAANSTYISSNANFTFNALSAVSNTSEFITLTMTSSSNIISGDILLYYTNTGNTVLSGLANNSYYYAVQANTTGIKLSSTFGGTAIDITAGTSETGHNLTKQGKNFITIANNQFANSDTITYHAISGNSALTNLANNTTYFVIGANSTGIRLSSNFYFTNATFNANTGVDNATDFITTIATNVIANDDLVYYSLSTGNTVLSGLTTESYYYAVAANSIGLKLAHSYNGTPIDIAASTTSETGHNLKRLGPVININPENNSNGHFFTGQSKVDVALNYTTFGANVLTSNVSTILDDALTEIPLTIGKISSLTGVNPGRNYDGDVRVRVRDHYTAGYGLFDANGRIQGDNANVSGRALRGDDIPLTFKVKDSGFGYNTDGEGVVLINTANNSKTITGNVVLGAIGVETGFWENDRGKLSENKFISDNFYYQEYSYEIQFTKTLDKYVDILKQVVHPSGNKVFGKPVQTEYSTIGITIPEESLTSLVVSFNALSEVSNTNDTITISQANTYFPTGTLLRYLVATGNTVVSGLANNNTYYVSFANASVLALSSSLSGANINITSTVSETGHTLTFLVHQD